MDKKKVIRFVVAVVKYAITLLLGYLTGDGSVSNLLNF